MITFLHWLRHGLIPRLILLVVVLAAVAIGLSANIPTTPTTIDSGAPLVWHSSACPQYFSDQDPNILIEVELEPHAAIEYRNQIECGSLRNVDDSIGAQYLYDAGTREVHIHWWATVPVKWQQIDMEFLGDNGYHPIQLQPGTTDLTISIPSHKTFAGFMVLGLAPELPPAEVQTVSISPEPYAPGVSNP